MVTHYEVEFIKSKLHHMSLIVIWLGWKPPTLTPRVQGARWGSGASGVHFSENFIKQKLQGTPKLVGVGYLRQPQVQIWKDLDSLSRRFYKIKVVVHNHFFLPSTPTPG